MRSRLLVLTATLLALSSCGSSGRHDVAPEPDSAEPPAASSTGGPMPTKIPAASGPVATAGVVTVLDDGDGPELCLGPVLTSLPPQCGGPRLVGFAWTDHAGQFDKGSGVRWGEFTVTGTFDGTTFTVSSVLPTATYWAVPLPYDGTAAPNPELSEGELLRIQRRLECLPGMLTASFGHGHVDVEVVHDDGSLQAWADATYGPGLVRISSALVPASG